MKKAVAFLIAIAICALTHPSLVLPGQKPASPPTAKLRRLNKAIAGQYIVVGAGDANVDASCTSPAHLAGPLQ